MLSPLFFCAILGLPGSYTRVFHVSWVAAQWHPGGDRGGSFESTQEGSQLWVWARVRPRQGPHQPGGTNRKDSSSGNEKLVALGWQVGELCRERRWGEDTVRLPWGPLQGEMPGEGPQAQVPLGISSDPAESAALWKQSPLGRWAGL